MQGSDGVASIVKLASKIARERKIKVEKAYTLIVDIISGSDSSPLASNISNDHGDTIAEIQTQMVESLQRKAIACTTILIQSRINPDWTLEDTMELQPELLADFSKLYEEEEQKIDSAEGKKDKDEEAAEIVGK